MSLEVVNGSNVISCDEDVIYIDGNNGNKVGGLLSEQRVNLFGSCKTYIDELSVKL